MYASLVRLFFHALTPPPTRPQLGEQLFGGWVLSSRSVRGAAKTALHRCGLHFMSKTSVRATNMLAVLHSPFLLELR